MSDISDVCFISVKDGLPFNKFEITKTTRTGISAATIESWWFDTMDDADKYRLFLLLEEGYKNLGQAIHSVHTPSADRADYKIYRASLDLHQYDEIIRQIKFTTQKRSIRWIKSSPEC